MKTSKITLLLAIVGILILIFIAQSKPIQTATIKSIKNSNYKTTIKLQNHPTELIIFDTISLNLNPGDKVKFKGKPSIYKNKKQIIIEKIEKC